MTKILLTVPSVTYAAKARRILAKSGLRSRIVKTEGNNDGECTHGLEINGQDFLDVVRLFIENGIPYRLSDRGNGG